MTAAKEPGADGKAPAEKVARDAGQHAKDVATNAAAEIESLGARAKEAGAEVLDDARERASELAPKAGAAVLEAAEAGRESAAAAIDRAADSLEDRAEGAGPVPEKAAEYAAAGMHATAGYLQDRDTAEIVAEAEQYVKAHPVRSVAAAVVAGFFVGRLLR